MRLLDAYTKVEIWRRRLAIRKLVAKISHKTEADRAQWVLKHKDELDRAIENLLELSS